MISRKSIRVLTRYIGRSLEGEGDCWVQIDASLLDELGIALFLPGFHPLLEGLADHSVDHVNKVLKGRKKGVRTII